MAGAVQCASPGCDCRLNSHCRAAIHPRFWGDRISARRAYLPAICNSEAGARPRRLPEHAFERTRTTPYDRHALQKSATQISEHC